MRYLLDTNIVIDHLKGREVIHEDILIFGAGISIITLGELIYGAHKSNNIQKSLEKLEAGMKILKLEIVNLNGEVVSEFGKMKAGLEIAGERLEDFDLLIAATALMNNLTLVSKNTKHFQRIKGLKLID